MKGILKNLIYHCSLLLSLLNKLIPKQNNRIVFYSNLGFRDNVKALYDYMIEKGLNSSYKVICSTNDYKKLKKQKIKNVIFTNTYAGVYYFFTSKYFFYSFGKYPIKPTKNQMVVNLFHGTPLKRIGNMEKGNTRNYNFFTYVLATSPFFEKIMMQSFNCKKEQVLIEGHARNDVLFLKDDNILIKKNYKKMIFWLPTYRYDNRNKQSKMDIKDAIPILKNYSVLSDLNNLLKRYNFLLFIKLHPLQNLDIRTSQNFSNVILYSHKEFTKNKLDLYKILSISDALITDYSSVYFDYLLLNRPIAFDICDIDKYKHDRGLVFDNPLDFMPGNKMKNIEDLHAFISNLYTEKDEYIEKRNKINDFVNFYKDGNSCKRILEKVGILK